MLRAVLIFCCLVAAQGGWVDLYKFPWTGVPLPLMLDVACVEEGTCFVPGSTGSSAEAVWKTTDDFKTMSNCTMHGTGLLLLAIAMGNTKDGVVGGIGALKLPGLLYTKDGGQNWVSSSDILPVETQDVVFISGDEYGWVGELDILTNEEGVATTKDGGVGFTGHKWTKALESQLPGNCSIRYAAFPTSQTIYATCGSWPESNNTQRLRLDEQRNVEFDISSRWTVHHSGHGIHAKTEIKDRTRVPVSAASNGYTAGIAKSTDGGASWTVSYKSTDTFYFNDICCFTETNCFAAGEGFAEDGSQDPGARVWQTTDGATWKQTQLIPTSSALRCMAVSATEGWVAVSVQAGKLTTQFYHSTDAGKTWSVDSSVDGVGEVMGLDFVNGNLGYAVGITELKITTPMKYTA